ncbi:hypothetical protein HJC23_009893 [Cyclotella cryptica]|uniref:Uncharacterized protein n=1 Tax=Cyclotella cryptica TaxID=29204 RepID=A0ABD3QAX8_9STRA
MKSNTLRATKARTKVNLDWFNIRKFFWLKEERHKMGQDRDKTKRSSYGDVEHYVTWVGFQIPTEYPKTKQ